MKALKSIMPFGMLSSIAFFTMVILGQTLRNDYNPITSYISELTADGAPYTHLLRIFLNASHMCLIIFAVGMSVLSFIYYRPALQFGYSSLFIMALISIVGFDLFPMTIDFIFSIQNIVHILITTVIVGITIVATIFISYGYMKHKRLNKLGWISTILTVLFTVFNIALLISMILQSNIIGLIQRLGVYTFYLLIFILSFHYTFKFNKSLQ